MTSHKRDGDKGGHQRYPHPHNDLWWHPMLTSITNNISILILIGGGVQVVQQKMNREVARTISNGAFDSKEQVHHVADYLAHGPRRGPKSKKNTHLFC